MFTSVDISWNKEKLNVPAFDYTKMTAINMCPRWGLVRYDQHRRMPGEGRSMPLEMGSTAHDGFATVRLSQLLEFGPEVYGGNFDAELVHAHGIRLLGAERYNAIRSLLGSSEDLRQRFNAAAIHAINSSGFYDDPSDKRRTLSNLETSMVAYIDRQDNSLVPYYDYDSGVVGVEQPFDLVMKFLVPDDKIPMTDNEVTVRYIGRIDGLHWNHSKTKVEVHENKTASRLDNAWMDSFIMSHQVTGYCVAASELVGVPVRNCVVHGLMVPLPKTYDLGGVATNPQTRDDGRITEWLKWFWTTMEMWNRWKDDPLNAPEYTHSCNRYFRSCSFIPLCGMTGEDRQIQFDGMEIDQWSPLHERAEV